MWPDISLRTLRTLRSNISLWPLRSDISLQTLQSLRPDFSLQTLQPLWSVASLQPLRPDIPLQALQTLQPLRSDISLQTLRTPGPCCSDVTLSREQRPERGGGWILGTRCCLLRDIGRSLKLHKIIGRVDYACLPLPHPRQTFHLCNITGVLVDC